jgi:hypothetical protein
MKQVLSVVLLLIITVLIGTHLKSRPIENPKTNNNNSVLNGRWNLVQEDWQHEKNTQIVTVTCLNETVNITKEDGTALCNGTLSNTFIFESGVHAKPKNTNAELPSFITGCDFGGLGIDLIYIHNENYMKTDTPMNESARPAIFQRL